MPEPGTVEAIVAIVAGATGLQLFFGLVAARWPQSYYSATDVVDKRIAGKWYRYPLYRFAPIYFVATVAAATISANRGLIPIVMAGIAVLHMAATVGRALVTGVRESNVRLRVIVVQLSTAVGIAGATLAANLTFDFWRTYLPGFDKYVEVLSTGIVAAIVTLYLLRWTTSTSGAVDYEADLLRDIPQSLIDAVVKYSAEYRVDRDLALTILATENMQRPKSSRSIERLLGRIGLARTHGPMQGSRNWRASDNEAIRDALSRLAGTTLPRDRYMARQVDVLYALEKHNRSTRFIEAAEPAFQNLSGRTAPSCWLVGEDGSPAVRVLNSRRDGRLWTITGDMAREIGAIQAEAWSNPPMFAPGTTVQAEILEEISITEGRYRKLWILKMDIRLDSLRIVGLYHPSAVHEQYTDHQERLIEHTPTIY